MATTRRRALIAVQVVFGAAVVWYATRSILLNWSSIRQESISLAPNWGLLLGSSLVILLAYLILISAWRRLMQDWGASMALPQAIRIWFVASLGRYVPGRIWSVGAIALLAPQAGVSPVAAVGAASLQTIINTIVGATVMLSVGGPAFAARLLEERGVELPGYTLPLVVSLGLLGILALPLALPPTLRLLTVLLRRPLPALELPAAATLRTSVACALAWLLYGVAFFLFCRALFPESSGALIDYVTAYTASYLIGYVLIFAPGGLVVREGALVATLTSLALLGTPEAWVAAWGSRLWLTVIDGVPGLLLLWLGPSLPRAERSGGAGSQPDGLGDNKADT